MATTTAITKGSLADSADNRVVSAAAVASEVISAAPCCLQQLEVSSDCASAQWVHLYDSTTVPTDHTAQVEIFSARADVADDLDGEYFQISDSAGTVGVWFDTDDSGTTIPSGASALDRAIEVTGVVTGDTATSVAAAVVAVVHADSEFTCTNVAEVITLTQATKGDVGDFAAGDSGFDTNSVTTNGVTSIPALSMKVAADSNVTLPFPVIFSTGCSFSNSSTAHFKTIGAADCMVHAYTSLD